jgi:hypothetical protein
LSFDGAGNLFVATSVYNPSSGDCCEVIILKIAPNGTRTTFADDASNHVFCQGLAIDASDNVFAMFGDSDTGAQTIYKFLPDATRSTFASLTSIQSLGLAFDSAGFLYVAQNFDAAASEIWKFAPDGTPSLFVTASLGPDWFLSNLAFDRFGNLFVSGGMDALGSGLILKYAPDGTESTFATGIKSVRDLAFDNSGHLFLVDILGGNILRFTPGGVMSVFASGLATPEYLAFPR